MVDMFTKPLGLEKLWPFSSMIGLQHLDMPNLRGRNKSRSEKERDDVRKAKSDMEFNFGMAEEAKCPRQLKKPRKDQAREQVEEQWLSVD